MNIEVVQGISPMGILTCSYWIKESYAIMLFFKVEIYMFLMKVANGTSLVV